MTASFSLVTVTSLAPTKKLVSLVHTDINNIVVIVYTHRNVMATSRAGYELWVARSKKKKRGWFM